MVVNQSVKEKLTAIVLGGTNPHIALIENLKKRGYYTILIDYYKYPPAKYFADEHIQESTLDKELVLSIAQLRNANLVISTCVDQANLTACYIAEKLGLPTPYNFQTALNVTNKIEMKRKMKESNVPTSNFQVFEGPDQLDELNMSYPLIVKPADSTGSKGVKKVNNLSDLKIGLIQALEISRVKKAIIEEYKEGIEIGIDCFIQEGIAHILTIRQKLKIHDRHGIVEQSLGSLIPAEISKKTQDSIKAYIEIIAKIFALDNTPFLMQAIVRDNDVNVIEFAPRIGGGLNYYIVKHCSGFDIVNAAVDSFLGINTKVTMTNPNIFYAANHIYARPGIYGAITGHEELIKQGIIKHFTVNKSRGMIIGPNMTSSDRVGSFLVEDKSKQSLFQKIQLVIEKLNAYDNNDQPIMIKEIYDFERFL